MRTAVRQAILSMRARYFDRITLGEIASEVFVSPFHLTRIFAQDTGVTPGRFLTSIRLFEAKRLLLTTSMTVSDIVCSVGYSSVGTFTKRFTQSVGLTPTQYRDPEVGALLVAVAPDFHQLPAPEQLRRAGAAMGVRAAVGGSVVAALHLPDGAPANILVGAFGSRIPQNAPVAYTALTGIGPTDVAVNNVPAGEWTIIAVAESADGPNAGVGLIGTVRVPVTVTAGRITRIALRLRPVTVLDPPIAITLASKATWGGVRTPLQRRPALRAAA